MGRKYSALFLFIYLLFIPTSIVFSQEKSKILPYKPAVPSKQKDSAPDLEAKIAATKQDIKVTGYYPQLLQYTALRKDDLSICPNSDCRRDVEGLLIFRYRAEGECSKIKFPFNKELCEALKSNNCGQMDELNKKQFCDAMISEDVDSLVRLAKTGKPFIGRSDEDVRASMLQDLGIYLGFKHYNSSTACEKYMNQVKIDNKAIPLFRQFACQILFYPDADKAFDDILTDLSIFSVARKKNDETLCKSIQHHKIKEACLSSSFQSLDDIFASRGR